MRSVAASELPSSALPVKGSNDPAPEAPPYGSQHYWEHRYTERADEPSFEWYGSLNIFLEALSRVLTDKSLRILHVGSGNSRLPQELWEMGYHTQVANDISATVVKRMADRTASCHGLTWAVEDVLALPHADGSFDVVVDKGTYDALSCEGNDIVHRMHREVRRVLKPKSGVYVCISSIASACSQLVHPMWKLHGADGRWEVQSTQVIDPRWKVSAGWVHSARFVEDGDTPDLDRQSAAVVRTR